MKAKVIATGEIVDVSYSHTTSDGVGIYKDNQERYWSSYQLECKETYIDWEQRRFELIKAAFQGLSANPYEDIVKMGEEEFADLAISYADAVIAKLKEE